MTDKVLLQLLVRIVYRELLEKVLLKHLEAEDVEDADGDVRRGDEEGLVDRSEEPVEEARVQMLQTRSIKVPCVAS